MPLEPPLLPDRSMLSPCCPAETELLLFAMYTAELLLPPCENNAELLLLLCMNALLTLLALGAAAQSATA